MTRQPMELGASSPRMIQSCEVCGSERLTSVLDLGSQPLCDDLVPFGDARLCREFPIDIVFCDTCITAHQRFQVAKRELFPRNYHYRARFTADVLNGMEQLVDSYEERFGSIDGCTVLDVGCNDGSLLDRFRRRGAARTIGIEPTDAYRDAAQKGHQVIDDFLSLEVAETIARRYGTPDVITFTNVFAHIENLREVLDSLRRLIGPGSTVVIENHYLGAVLERRQFDTFYHEHPRTYSYTSFEHVASALAIPLAHAEFPSRYGGNIRVFLSRRAGHTIGLDADSVRRRERSFGEDFGALRKHVEEWRLRKGRVIQGYVAARGKLRAKAFPGRAAILVKLLDLTEDAISAVFEKPGSLKIGNYVPGTRIPILSDDVLFGFPEQTQPVLNLAWHIPREIRSYLSANGYTGPVIDIVSADDFAPAA